MSKATEDAGRLDSTLSEVLGPLPEAVRPIAYLYHDAASAEAANPMLHSTLVVMAVDRRPALRNETPLVTLAQAQAMLAAERERWRDAVEALANSWDDPAEAYGMRLALKEGLRA